MFKISIDEVAYLLSQGYKHKDDIHKTYSGHSIYYATESAKLVQELSQYRKNHIVG